MRITAAQINRWAAGNRAAQGTLPILMRRLIGASTKAQALVVPGGDAVVTPGWDGLVDAVEGDAWVPTGPSCWEFGCSADVRQKADADFHKRSGETPAAHAAETSFVFVTPRKWRLKDAWLTDVRAKQIWKEVRVYDALDLEHWLETKPSVALWFGEQLDLAGPGIQSLDGRWSHWGRQTTPAITADAFLHGRAVVTQTLVDAVAEGPELLVVEADSCDEASAFAAIVLEQAGFSGTAAYITHADGWRFCDANDGIAIGIAATPEVAAARVKRKGFTLLAPANIAEARDRRESIGRIRLERQRGETFEEALRLLGEERSDAARLRLSTGRSWSVYRRLRADNAALRNPIWLHKPISDGLVAITLAGTWNGDKPGDRTCLEAITGKSYEALETGLRHLARLDDSPVLQIGAIWKAKAPIDLLHLVVPDITQSQFARFFKAVESVLAKPDPALELADADRWAAAVYGKERGETGLLLEALVDSLAKLKSYAEEAHDPIADKIGAGVDAVVHHLLHNASGERWLSLAGMLTQLAEAAPDVFLSAIEESLRAADRPVTRLITETRASHGMGRAWQTGLLWALETLGWSAERLTRVCRILATLSNVPSKSDWANTPLRSLYSFFRPWMPQTAAPLARRLAALDRIIADDSDVGWKLLLALVPHFGEVALTNAKPRWRDDDAGTPERATPDEYEEMLSEAGKRLIVQAANNPRRIADLVKETNKFEGDFQDSIVALAESAKAFAAPDREIVRTSLRAYLSLRSRLDDSSGDALVKRLSGLLRDLEPDDAIERGAWLFVNGWVSIPKQPGRSRKDEDVVRHEMRRLAMRAILDEGGVAALPALAARSGNDWLVGWEASHADIAPGELTTWMAAEFRRNGSAFHQKLIGGVLAAATPARRADLFNATLRLIAKPRDEEIAALLSCLRADEATLELIEAQPAGAQAAYWKTAEIGSLIDAPSTMIVFAEHLLASDRPRSAFLAVSMKFEDTPPALVMQMLEGIVQNIEPDGPLPDGYHIGEALGVAEKDADIPRRRLAMVEYNFFHWLEHDAHGVPNLIGELMRDPLFFVALVLAASPKASADGTPIDERTKVSAQLAWYVVHNGRGTPGVRDGVVDETSFAAWIKAAREQAIEADRANAVDSAIGQWLSSCPSDPDGSWPCQPVRELLDREDADRIRTGFTMGVGNNRGMTSRQPDEGGKQEDALVKRYKDIAEQYRDAQPRLASVFDDIASHYSGMALRHDRDAQLSSERP